MKSTGVVRRIDELGRIVIPKEIRRNLGIRDGEKIRLIGQGKDGKNGGKKGDLLIQIHIEEDKKFKLKELT